MYVGTISHDMVKRKVTGVIDGDTFKVNKPVQGSDRIRIADKNAPERGERGYKKAKDDLAQKIQDKTVDINPVGKSYGRTVADVKKNNRKIK